MRSYGSVDAARVAPLTALSPSGLAPTTHCSPWPISRRATGLPRNLTFAHAAEKVSDSDSSRSQEASFERERISAERLHPKTAYSRCRPIAEEAIERFKAEEPSLNE